MCNHRDIGDCLSCQTDKAYDREKERLRNELIKNLSQPETAMNLQQTITYCTALIAVSAKKIHVLTLKGFNHDRT